MGRESPLPLNADKPAGGNRFPASPRDRPGKAFSCLFPTFQPFSPHSAGRFSPGNGGRRCGTSRQPFLRFRSDARYNCQAFHKLCHST